MSIVKRFDHVPRSIYICEAFPTLDATMNTIEWQVIAGGGEARVSWVGVYMGVRVRAAHREAEQVLICSMPSLSCSPSP